MSDMELAQKIVEEYGSFVGSMGTLRPNIAEAVAKGIAVGREQGLRQAVSLIEAELATT